VPLLEKERDRFRFKCGFACFPSEPSASFERDLNEMALETLMTEPSITPELVREHGLTSDEYERIKQILGREPTFTELGIFSVMWSEHCSYKNTRPLLKLFPRRRKRGHCRYR
jgi:hypothetical protein